jgi:hypothetical protein
MAVPKSHGILSELHRLLGIYQREDFLAASTYPGLGRPLREALICLASESQDDSTRPSPPRRTQVSKREPGPSASVDIARLTKDALVDLILRSEHGDSFASLVRFAGHYGLDLQGRPKDGRERVAKRLASIIMSLPDSERIQASSALLGKVSNQTQGWIDVIKRNRT